MINEIVCMFFKIEIFILACIQIRAKSNDGKMNLNKEIIKLAGKTYSWLRTNSSSIQLKERVPPEYLGGSNVSEVLPLNASARFCPTLMK